MDYKELMDRIEKLEYDISNFSKEILEERAEKSNITSSLTTNLAIAHQSLYIARIVFKEVCKEFTTFEGKE